MPISGKLEAFRLFEQRTPRAVLQTLFHGVDGSRTINTGTWYRANVRLVRDGSGQQARLCGFHSFATRRLALQYRQRFDLQRRRIVVRRVYLDGRIWRKATNRDVILSTRMYVVPSR